ncbi:hypothetical protein [Agromyces sp. ZXT2-6]|uniref:hypothetical protein n=1 Tax=Agromyces sp. ZXT2-6 TaxID=3461153 RepID=UPI004054F0E9
MRGTGTTIGQAPIVRHITHITLLAAMLVIASAVAIAVVHQLMRVSGRHVASVDGAAAAACLIVGVLVAAVLLAALVMAVARHRRPEDASGRAPRLTSRHRAAANATVWAVIATLAVGAAADAFTALPGGAVAAGALIAGLLGGVTGAVHRRAHGQAAYRSFNMVALLLAAGCLASMSMTTTGAWWALNFSTLGTSDDLAAVFFNLGLILSGLAMAAMSGRLASGIERPEHAARRGAVPTVRALIAVIGISLAGVGFVPIDTDEVLHNTFACAAGAAFALLASLTPVLVRRMPRSFAIMSRASLVLEVSAFVVYDRLGLVSLTVFEIVAFALVFVWLITLVVTTHPVVIHELSELGPAGVEESDADGPVAPVLVGRHRRAGSIAEVHVPVRRLPASVMPARGMQPAYAGLS